jgi:hypothetical protein
MSITSTRLLAAWEQIEAGLEANQDALQLDGVDACRAQLAAELSHLRSSVPSCAPNPWRPPGTSMSP